jgi:hypothetical protein
MYSKFRPPQGTRTSATAGPSITLAPLMTCSAPIAAPARSMSSGRHVCASVRMLGHCVTPTMPSATPCGPSSKYSGDTPRRGMPAMAPTYEHSLRLKWHALYGALLPDASCTFSSSVSCATSARADVYADAGHTSRDAACVLMTNAKRSSHILGVRPTRWRCW